MSGARPVRAAVVQMTSGDDVVRNVAAAGELVARAARDGARIVVLPEKWNVIDTDARQAARAEPLDGPSLTAAAGWARDHAITLVAGSVSVAVPGDRRAANACVVFDAAGRRRAVYRKIHLFDVEVGGHAYRESAGTVPGDAVVVAGADGLRIGLSVCYDLRFPELFRALSAQGADLITAPAAFTAVTGAAHWEVLVRARAVENQVFVLAAGQVGEHATGTASFGHSMIVDAWGTVLARIDDGPGVAVADLDLAARDDLRSRLPVLAHRRIPVGDRPGTVRPADASGMLPATGRTDGGGAG